MKHITFDQSTVLNEYARIAHEKQFVKTAEDLKPRDLPEAPAPKSIDIAAPEVMSQEEKQMARPTLSREPSVRDVIKIMQEFGAPMLYNNLIMGRDVPKNQKVGQAIANSFPAFINNYAQKSKSIGEYRNHMQLIRSRLLKYFVDMMDADSKKPINTEKFLKGGFDQYVAQFEALVPEMQGLEADDEMYSDDSLGKEAGYKFLSSQDPLGDALRYLNDYWAKMLSGGSADYKKMQPLYEREKNNVVSILTSKFGKNPQFVQAMEAFKNQASQISQAWEGEKTANMKTADSKLYDVTKETGEDLVDAAHPGGGTSTELSHSKTKENLVETIVEQQEADLEVAKSVPKGTYANLVALYNTLHKMGHKDRLGDLIGTIRLIATPEDVLNHVLITLADELDKRGFSDSANSVDAMLKTAQTAQQFIQNLVGQLRKNLNLGFFRKDEVVIQVNSLISSLQGLGNSDSLVEAYDRSQSIIQSSNIQDEDVKLQAENILRAVKVEYRDAYIAEKMQAQEQPQQPQTVNLMEQFRERMKEKEKTQGVPEKGKKKNWLHEWWKDPTKVKAIVNRYNEAVKDIAGEEQVSLDVKGAQKALQRVKPYGKDYWRKFEEEMAGKKGKSSLPPESPRGPTDYSRYDDILGLLEKKILARYGRGVDVSKGPWRKWITEQAYELYALQGKEGKEGPAQYSPEEMMAHIDRRLDRIKQ